MATLPNPQDEIFCQHVATGISQTEAARRAGHPQTQAHNIGCRLAKRQEIQERIAEIIQAEAEKPTSGATREQLETDLYAIIGEARSEKEFAAAIRGVEVLAKIKGYLVERKDPGRQRSARPYSEDVLTALREELDAMPAADRARYLLTAPDDVKQALDDEPVGAQGPLKE